jgi:transcriptional regulator with XRE-family HTH domain
MLAKNVLTKIREQLSKRVKQETIAKEFGVSRSLVSDIACGRAYKESYQAQMAVDPTNARIQELEAEVVHLKEERDREKRHAKANAKVAGLFTAMVDELEASIKPFDMLPTIVAPTDKAEITEHCVLHLSDGHHDSVVKPEAVGGLEEYNFPISCARAEGLVDTVVDWTQGTLAPRFRFPVLWVLAYGDFTSGEIHRAAERSYYRNQIKNCLAIGQLHALMLRDLSAHFETVNVLYLSGNHGRRSPKKDYLAPHENWDYLVAEIARLHCRNLVNVDFQIPDAWSVNLDINGIGFNVSHGDDVSSNAGVPWYGMTRRQKSLTALGAMTGGQRVRYYCMGHHHTGSTLSDIDGELLVNGAWLGTDSFAYNRLAGYRDPMQWLHGVNGKYGISWRMACKLRCEYEKKGPKRYLIDGGRDIGPLV